MQMNEISKLSWADKCRMPPFCPDAIERNTRAIHSFLVWVGLMVGVLSSSLSFASIIPAPEVNQCLRIDGQFGVTGYWLTEQETLDEWGRITRTRYPEFTVDYLTPVPPGTYNGNVPFYCNTRNIARDDGTGALLEKVYSCQYRTVGGDVNLGEPHMDVAGDGKRIYTCWTPDTVDPKNNGASCPVGGGKKFFGNPINAGTGNKVEVERDYASRRLNFTRTYNSNGDIPNTALGPRWIHSFQLHVDYVAFSPTGEVNIQREDGRNVRFHQSGTSWIGDADNVDRLVRMVDGQGVATGWELTTPTTVEKYAPTGEITEVFFITGERLTFTYSDVNTPQSITPFNGMLIKVQSSFGDNLQFKYDAYRRLKELIDPAGGTTSYAYTTDRSLLASVTYPDGKQKRYHYGEPLLTGGTTLPYALTGITDESNVRFANFEYDSSGRGIATEHSGGVNRFSIAYNAGQANVTTPLGAVDTVAFGTVNGLVVGTSQSQPAGAGCGPASNSTTYDANANASIRTDFDGNQTTYVYDLSRNLETSRTEAAGTAKARSITTQWHPTYRLPIQIDEPGKRTTYTHDASGNVLTTTVLDTTTSTSRTSTFTYNSFGQVLTIDGPRTDASDITTYTYYACTTGVECGQVHTITDALGHLPTFNTYNAHGQPLTIMDANGVVTTLAYDLRQRLTSRTVAGETTNFFYYPTGLLQQVAMPDGSFVNYVFDAAHRLIEIDDSLGNRMVYTLDAMGNRTAENLYDPSNALTRTHSRVFDSLSRLAQDLTASGSATQATLFGYDANGNQTTINAPLSRNATNAYDELNRLRQVTDANNGITQYGYDSNDNLVSVTDPRNLQTTYTYNALGDLLQQSSPDTGSTTNTFDSAGNLKTSTDARNKTATYSYDALNRVTQVVYPDQTLTYTYDTGSNAIGRLSSVTDNSGSTSWTYTPQGRIASKTQTMGARVLTVSYGYNPAGQLTTVTTPSNKTITYAYTNNQITGMQVNSVNLLSNVVYEPFGPTSGWTWGNGTLAVRTYDTDGKITQLDSAGFKTINYDDAFRITNITDTINAAFTWNYGYDPLDRLNSATSSTTSQSFTFDANGNRLTQGGSTSSTFTTATTNNRLSSITGALSKTYSYDSAGNTTSDGTITYGYNAAGRMTSATKAGVTTTYTYNALGQRVTKTTSGNTTYFVYDEAGHLLGEYDQTGTLIQEIVWLNDIPVASIRFGSCGIAIFYIHTDHLNTPRRITKRSTPAVVWRHDSDAFGTTPPNENPSGLGTFEFNPGFAGQYRDKETGLSYNYFRDCYDPVTGRYCQSDPIGLHGGINTYTYALNNPLYYTDPLGLDVEYRVVPWWYPPVTPGEQSPLERPPGGFAEENWAKERGKDFWSGLQNIGQLIKEKCGMNEAADDDDNCEALYKSTLRTCASLSGKKKFRCYEAARENREQCYQQRNTDRK